MYNDRENQMIGQIYDAAFDPTLWVGVMESMTEELSGHTACMTILDVYTGLGTGFAAYAPSGTMDKYFARWTKDNPLHQIGDTLNYLQGWRASTIRYEDWVEQTTLHKSAFFNEFLRPLGAEHGIMMGVALIDTSTITMNIARPLHRDIFSDAELARARRWQDHLSRAVRLGNAVQINQAALDAIEQLVSTTPHCLFFLDDRGRVKRMSATAEAMLVDGRELYLASGILSACQPDEEKELRRLVARAANRDRAASTGGSMRIRRCGKPSYEVQVTPLGPRSSANWSSAPIILVTIADDHGASVPIELKLRSRFGFTPAEVRVALALMHGGSLRETADAAGVSVNTVRAQLASIFEKTGHRRQVELVRALIMVDQNSNLRSRS